MQRLSGEINACEADSPGQQKMFMHPRIAVIIATRGRPREIANLLAALDRQTRQPDRIIISATEPDDVSQTIDFDERVHLILGSPGLAAQRNRAWAFIKGAIDIIIFFDDDFIPSRFWIERAGAFFSAHPDVVSVTGRLIKDGVLSRGIDWEEGLLRVEEADLEAKPFSPSDCLVVDRETPYGCNMAFRAGMVEHLTFDERLVLYGWLEDRDFGIRAAAMGKTIWTDAFWGVHLGIKEGGRQSGLRLGYSQVVNPWYLMQKGVLTRYQTGQNIFRRLIGNAVGSVLPNPRVDRRGRLKGNLIGIKDIVCGSWAPERVIEL